MIISTRNTRVFSDFDINFSLHPRTKGISIKYDEDSIKQSIRNLIFTKNFERPFHSEIGSQVSNILFNVADEFTLNILKQTIINCINNFEPRVILKNVEIVLLESSNEVHVTIEFMIKNTTRIVLMDLLLERTR